MQLILINKDNVQLDLLNNDNYFIMTKCESLHGIETDIATIESPFIDGAEVESVKALPRGISMTFKVIPDIKNSIDFFTNVVKSKQYVTLQLTENNQTISIKGVATIPPYSRMMAACEISLNIYCSQPYWEDATIITDVIAKSLNELFFPVEGQYFTPIGRIFGLVNLSLEKTFINSGDVSVGMNILITAIDTIVNPRISCETGDQNGWYMQLNLTLNPNDEVEINTTRGNKYIKINGSDTFNNRPVLSYLTFNGTDWLQLETGENTFFIDADEGEAHAYFTISYKRRYE